jgi:hypothetical protein
MRKLSFKRAAWFAQIGAFVLRVVVPWLPNGELKRGLRRLQSSCEAAYWLPDDPEEERWR